MFMMGLKQVSCANIGQQIGIGNIAMAQRFFRVTNVIAINVILLIAIGFYFAQRFWIGIFTSNQVMIDKALLLSEIYTFRLIPDLWAMQLTAVFTAVGEQAKLVPVTMMSYWFLHIPLAIIFAFYTPIGFQGCWISLALANLTMATYFSYLISKFDWRKLEKDSEEKLRKDTDGQETQDTNSTVNYRINENPNEII